MRSRQCTNPSPEFGGKDCSSLGASTETMKCKNDPCPGEFPTIMVINVGRQSSSIRTTAFCEVCWGMVCVCLEMAVSLSCVWHVRLVPVGLEVLSELALPSFLFLCAMAMHGSLTIMLPTVHVYDYAMWPLMIRFLAFSGVGGESKTLRDDIRVFLKCNFAFPTEHLPSDNFSKFTFCQFHFPQFFHLDQPESL